MTAKDPRRSGNPAARAAAGTGRPAPQSSAFHTRSRALLVRLSAMPSLVVPVGVLVLMLVGLMAPLPFAVPALVLVLVFVGWLAVLSWPILDTKGRLIRGILFGLVMGALIGRLTGTL